MKARAFQRVVNTVVAVVLVGFFGSFAQSNQSGGTQRSEINAQPLLLEKSEGELRTRRIHTNASVPASSQFMLKVSPKNNGSQRLVAGTEDLAPERTYRSTGT
jgi:hypothetical protein